jgi:hypothetical protein
MEANSPAHFMNLKSRGRCVWKLHRVDSKYCGWLEDEESGVRVGARSRARREPSASFLVLREAGACGVTATLVEVCRMLKLSVHNGDHLTQYLAGRWRCARRFRRHG